MPLMFIFQLLFAFSFSDITFTFLFLVAPANIFCRFWHLHTRPKALSSFLLAGRVGTADWDITVTFGLLVTNPFLLVPCRDGVSCIYQTQTFHFSTPGILALLVAFTLALQITQEACIEPSCWHHGGGGHTLAFPLQAILVLYWAQLLLETQAVTAPRTHVILHPSLQIIISG